MESTFFFSAETAQKYGLNEAIVLHQIVSWIRHNAANHRNFHDGRYWTYNSVRAWGELMPFFTKDQIRRAIDSLERQGAIVTGNYNPNKGNRTQWYGLSDEYMTIWQICQMQLAGMPNVLEQSINQRIDVEPSAEQAPSEPSEQTSSVNLKETVLSTWNNTAVSLPKLRAITDARMKHVRARIAESSLADFLDAIARVEASDFLSGRNGQWTKCDFDWMLKPENYNKILEGKYRNKGTASPNTGRYAIVKGDDAHVEYADKSNESPLEWGADG